MERLKRTEIGQMEGDLMIVTLHQRGGCEEWSRGEDGSSRLFSCFI